MTREEAIKYVQEWLKDEYALTTGDRAALNVAIEALLEPEIVRCKDCRWRIKMCGEFSCDLNCRVEDLEGTESDMWFTVKDDDFCSRGERKKGDDDVCLPDRRADKKAQERVVDIQEVQKHRDC